MFDVEKFVRNYQFQSEFMREYVAQEREQGVLEGRSAVILRQLAIRFGALAPDTIAQVNASSLAELDRIADRLLSAPTLEQALSPY